MDTKEIEERVNRAKDLFRAGYNCSQAVFGACADLLGFSDTDTAMKLASSFGGGMGRMRKTCGAVCGMFLLEGLHSGGSLPTYDKKENYKRVQLLAETFRSTFGSTTCATLLGLSKDSAKQTLSSQPEIRTDTYYQKRPCVEIVGEATKIFLSSIN